MVPPTTVAAVDVIAGTQRHDPNDASSTGPARTDRLSLRTPSWEAGARGSTVAAVPSSALVVLVPEAEQLVGAMRLRHDPTAALGVPAHVTVVVPFILPVDDDTTGRIAEIARRQPRFMTKFTAVERFPGLVIWLRPEPSDPFSALIDATVAEFPDWPPYGGRMTKPIPHLTVADGVDEITVSALEAELKPRLPIRSVVNELALLAEDESGRWTIVRGWPLE